MTKPEKDEKEGKPLEERKGRGAPTLYQFAFLRLLRQEMQTRPNLTADALAAELRAEWQEVRAALKAAENGKQHGKKEGQ